MLKILLPNAQIAGEDAADALAAALCHAYHLGNPMHQLANDDDTLKTLRSRHQRLQEV